MTHINTEFPYRLGPTNPCPIAVHMDTALLQSSLSSVGVGPDDADYILEEASSPTCI
jgi:hypothetical protein